MLSGCKYYCQKKELLFALVLDLWKANVNYGYDMIYLLTAIGLSPGGSSTVHIYKQTVHRTTQNKQYIEEHNNMWECGPCPVLARFTLTFALQTEEKARKNLSQGSRV